VRLTNAPAFTGLVFDSEFTTSPKQMEILRFIVARWAAGESVFTNAATPH
jgi:hypothetical protein